MAVRHGKEGKVLLGANAVAEITRIEIVENVETGDSTVMGDSAQTHLTGIPSWSGSLECRYDPEDTNGQAALTIGASVTLNAYLQDNVSGRKYHTGTASVTSITKNGAFDGVGVAQFSFQGNGALTESTVV